MEAMSTKVQINKNLIPFLQEHKRFKVIYGGRGCVPGRTLIDTPNGQFRMDEFQGGQVYTVTTKGVDIAYAEKPVSYTVENMFKVTLANNKYIYCTDEHKFLTANGWITAIDLKNNPQPIMAPNMKKNPWRKDDLENIVNHLLSYMYCYALDFRQYGQQDMWPLGSYSAVIYILGREDLYENFLEIAEGFTFFDRYPPDVFVERLTALFAHLDLASQNLRVRGTDIGEKSSELIEDLHRAFLRFHENKNLAELIHKLAQFFQGFYSAEELKVGSFQTIFHTLECDVDDSSYSDTINESYSKHMFSVSSVEEYPAELYYDMFVPLFNNYLSNGIVNHNSGKSQGIADIMLLYAGMGKKIACFREFQNSIKDSVHSLMVEEIGRLKLGGFEFTETEIRHVSGGVIVFKGLSRNVESIKSMNSFNIAWVEESQTISEDSLRVLTPTFRAHQAEIWLSANPKRASDPFSQRFIERKLERVYGSNIESDELHMRLRLNYTDNPWFPIALESERLDDLNRLDRSLYNHIWEGDYNDFIADNIIKAEWVDAALGAKEALGYKDFGQFIAVHDPADSGDARGTLIKHGNQIIEVVEDVTNEINEACMKSCELARHYGATSYIYDSDGCGLGLRAQVKDFFGEGVNIYQFRGNSIPENPHEVIDNDSAGRPITNRSFYKNLRAHCYSRLATRFEKTYNAIKNKEYIDPHELISINPELANFLSLRSELTSIPRQYNNTGTYQVMGKKDMMQKLKLQSPNMADCLAMGEITLRSQKRWYGQLDPGISCA